MKQIKIEIYFSLERKYYISVDTYNQISFPNKTKAETFLRNYKRLLKENVSQLQILNLQLYTIYSYFYLQFDAKLTEDIDKRFDDFRSCYARIFKTFSSGNQTAFVFKNIEVCFSILFEGAYILRDFSHNNKNYSLTSQIRPLLKFISSLYKQYEFDKKNIFLLNKLEKVVHRIVKVKDAV